MKKYITAALAALTLLSLASCGNGKVKDDTNRIADDVKNEARSMTNDTERAVHDMTDGTMLDPNNNHNVDEYTANGTETK